MNPREITTRLSQEFPGKTILLLPENDPKEIICEIDPPDEHPDYSEAIAYIDESALHVHNNTTEQYHVEEGNLNLEINGVSHLMEPGQKYIVLPGQIHKARGEATRVRVMAFPAWTPADHIIVDENYERSGD